MMLLKTMYIIPRSNNIEDKIPNVNDLVKKTECNTKISEIERKVIIMIMINMLLHESLISLWVIYLMQEQYKKVNESDLNEL